MDADAMLARNRTMLTTGKYSDLTIKCGEEEFKVHQFILCPASKFFEVACHGGFVESQTATINLKDDDPRMIRRMLSYLYTLDYVDGDATSFDVEQSGSDIKSGSEICPPPSKRRKQESLSHPPDESAQKKDRENRYSSVLANIDVYAVADKYGLPELKELARTKFCNNSKELTLNEQAAIVPAVYGSTPSDDQGLRRAVSNYFVENMDDVLGDQKLSMVLRDVPDFGLDVFRVFNEYYHTLPHLRSEIQKKDLKIQELDDFIRHVL